MAHTLLLIGFVIFAATVAVLLAWLVAGRHQAAPILRAGAIAAPPTPPGDSIPLEAELRATVADLAAIAQRGGTGLEMGVAPGLALFLDRRLLQEATREVLFAALRAAPGGMVRIVATRRGRRLDLTFCDDGPVLDELARRVSLAGAASLLAPHGIEVLVQPRLGVGTSVTWRIPGHLVADRTPHVVAVAEPRALATTAC